MMAHIQAGMAASAANQERVAELERAHGASMMERFRWIGPPSFKGESSPDVAEGWIRETEKIFRAIRCPEEDKVPLATFTLQDRADVWWTSTLRTVFPGRDDIAWEEFLQVFRERFFPAHVQEKLELEFLALTQRSLSVMDYEARFVELEKFAPHICGCEQRRAAKFVRGLKAYIRSRVIVQDHQTLGSAVRAACLMEGEQALFLEERKASQQSRPAPVARFDRKRKFGQSSAAPSSAVRQPVPAAPAASQRGVLPACSLCGRQHGGSACLAGSGKCFTCGMPGHMSRECPQRKTQASAVPGRQSGPARVFVVTTEEAQATDHVTEWTVLFPGFRARVIFDSGATDSFVSACFAELLCNQCGVAISVLDSPLSVASPGGFLSVTHSLPEVDVTVDGRSLVALVHVLDMHDYDMILGMDWLGQHHALLDCHKRRVIFRVPGGEELVFQCPRTRSSRVLVSCLKAHRMISKGCETFLTSVVASSSEGSTSFVADIEVIREFPDVFSDDLPGLPPV